MYEAGDSFGGGPPHEALEKYKLGFHGKNENRTDFKLQASCNISFGVILSPSEGHGRLITIMLILADSGK